MFGLGPRAGPYPRGTRGLGKGWRPVDKYLLSLVRRTARRCEDLVDEPAVAHVGDIEQPLDRGASKDRGRRRGDVGRRHQIDAGHAANRAGLPGGSGVPRVLWTRIVGWACCLSQESSMGRRGYPPEFRRRAIALVEAGPNHLSARAAVVLELLGVRHDQVTIRQDWSISARRQSGGNGVASGPLVLPQRRLSGRGWRTTGRHRGRPSRPAAVAGPPRRKVSSSQ